MKKLILIINPFKLLLAEKFMRSPTKKVVSVTPLLVLSLTKRTFKPLLVLSPTRGTLLFAVLIVAFSNSISATGEDSTKIKYGINDPRNPDCPCHKYQQLADEEYNKIIGNEDMQMAVQNAADNIMESREDAQNEVVVASNEIAVKNSEKINKENNNINNSNLSDLKTTATNKVETSKVNKHVFRKHRLTKHRSTKPKKRKIRFGKRDGSRCFHW